MKINALPVSLTSNSIKAQILRLILGITVATLLVANVIELVSEYAATRIMTGEHVEKITNSAHQKIENYLLYGAEDKIPDYIDAFGFDPYIDKVCYYDDQYKLKAFFVSPHALEEYGINAYCDEDVNKIYNHDNDLTHIYDVRVITDKNGKTLASIFLKYDLEQDIYYFIKKETISFLTLLIALIFAYLLASRYQDSLTRPIMHLSGLAATLSEKQDYSLRAKKFNDDEIGLLSETFNDMIEAMGEANKQLLQARIEADHANHMKSDFLAVMSHEIRTPMNGIVGTADLLMETRLDYQQKHYAEVIVKSCQTLLDLINDVLDFSKIEAGKLELEHTDFDLVDHAQNIIDMAEITVHQKGLKLYFINNLSENYHVYGDPTRLRQVLTNLTSNAAKFTQDGSITISLDEVVADNLPSDKKLFKITVKDTGIGIAADRQEQIFDSFSQADTSTTRKYGGSGLGLSICKKLVTIMGGEIGVISTENQGSEFWFTVPLDLSSAPHVSEIALPSDNIIAPTDDNRIMLVEDNPTNVMITEEILRKAGYRIIVCEDGEKALQSYKEAPISTILMDCHMPVMDGFEATRKIREFERENNIPPSKIFALTASALKGDREKCEDAGMDDYISKPFRKADLLMKLQQIAEDKA